MPDLAPVTYPREAVRGLVDLAALEEAAALEKSGGRWQVRHVAAVLGLSRATIYRTPWLMAIRVKHDKAKRNSGVRWEPREVRLRDALRRDRDPQTLLPRGA